MRYNKEVLRENFLGYNDILYKIFLIISLFAKIYVREIFEISRFAKINVREIQFFWSRENYCSRKLMTLR